MSDYPVQSWAKKLEEEEEVEEAASASASSPTASRIRFSLTRKAGPLKRVLQKHLGGFGQPQSSAPSSGGGPCSLSTGDEEEDLDEEEETEEETWREEEELYFGNKTFVKEDEQVDGSTITGEGQIYANVDGRGKALLSEFNDGFAQKEALTKVNWRREERIPQVGARKSNGIDSEPSQEGDRRGVGGSAKFNESSRMKESNGVNGGQRGGEKGHNGAGGSDEEERQRRRRRPGYDDVDRARQSREEGEEILRALISPSAPSPPPEGDVVSSLRAAAAADKRPQRGAMTAEASSSGVAAAVTDLGSLSECCKERERRRLTLQAERDALRSALRATTQELSRKEEEMITKVGDLNRSYESSLAEMKNLLSTQRKVGNQWKGEMETLTQQFEVKLKTLQAENRSLRSDLEAAMGELEQREADLHEATEMNGIYSAKLTKLERKFKKLKDEDEESYMEMTF